MIRSKMVIKYEIKSFIKGKLSLWDLKHYMMVPNQGIKIEKM